MFSKQIISICIDKNIIILDLTKQLYLLKIYY